jgi:hypothetical protein
MKYGCLTVVGLLAIALIVGGAAVGVAVRQNRTSAFEQQALVQEVPESEGEGLRLNLEIHTAGVSVKPVSAGESVRVEADYDPRLFELQQGSERAGDGVVMTVELRPLGSKLMALLRVKVGGRPAMLRIGLPRDVPLEIDGRLVRSFAAMELGGLSLASTELKVDDGGVKVSFAEPLPAPMELLSIQGNRGSQSVVGLGNASPRKTVFFQHVGAVDLDLRGAWSRDAEIRVIGGVAGGSLWLPDNVTVRGLGERYAIRVAEDSELSLPTLRLSVSENMGRFVVMD